MIVKWIEVKKKGKRFPDNAEAVIQNIAYQTLEKIKLILEEDQLDDRECFVRIEKIIRLYKKIGSSCGSRHDFS